MENAQERKETPVFSGVLDYFPDAIREVARTSFLGNVQHNPGKDLFWDRSKSGDELDALTRHLMQAGTLDTDGIRHSAKVAWRALANLQKEIENDRQMGYEEEIIELSKEDDTMYPTDEEVELELYGVHRGPCVAHDSVSEEIVTAEEMIRRSDELKAERRMDIIGRNGNDGLHYLDEDPDVELPPDTANYILDKVSWTNKLAIQKTQQTTSMYPGDIKVTYTMVSTDEV